MDTKASSVTDMIKKLSDKKLLIYKKYQGVRLSNGGKKIAVATVRKHRLWESFLVEKLHFNWDEVHDIAEQLEHIKSEALINRLEAYLGYPKVDPHGDPIPDKNGNITQQEILPLSALTENDKTYLIALKDTNDDFLKYLNSKKLAIGTAITVEKIEPYDGSIEIETPHGKFLITSETAKNLLVKEPN